MVLNSLSGSLIIFAALVVGIRHGIDWDHIAAITDITSTQNSVKKGVLYSFLYGVGHASVVSSIALGVLFLGLGLPEGIESMMEIVVGITLILLGVYVFYSLHKHKGEHFRLLPRWALFANGLLNTWSLIKAKITGGPRKYYQILKDGYGNTASFVIGMIHGIGAETPSQMLLFAMAATAGLAGGKDLAGILIMVYSVGLITTNTIMGVLGSFGYVKSSNRMKLYRSVALVTGIFSLIIGLAFITGGVSYLPDIESLIGG